MNILNGFTPNTAKNMQLDAGILVKNLENIQSFDGTINDSDKIGATEGGCTFTAIPTIRNIFDGIDGAKGNYKDGNVIDLWEITLSGTMKEMTAENFKLALGASDVVEGDGTAKKFTEIKGRSEIKSEDYLDNVCWLGSQVGSDLPIIIELKNVMNTSGLSFTSSNNGSGAISFELKAHFDLNKAEEVPFVIYSPVIV